MRRFLGALLLGVTVLVTVGFATGRLASVVTNGVSMRPGYSAGDLVVVMRADRYAIGDVAAYRDDERGEVVLHRIVGGDADAFEFRGDANESIDAVAPTAGELVGREVLHLPKVGRWFGSPLMLAALAGVAIVLGALATIAPSNRATTAGTPSTPGERGRGRRRWRWWHAGLLALDAAVVAGLVAAWLVPPTVVPPPPVPMHVGALSYGAVVPAGDAYPDGVVQTGDTVFSRVADQVEVVFRYEGDADVPAQARLRTVIEAAGGWTTASALTSPTPVVAGGAELRGTIDLVAVQEMLRRVQDTTGVTLTTVQLRVEALVEADPERPAPVGVEWTPYRSAMQFRFDDLGLDLAETSVVTESLDGPAVVSSEPARVVTEEAREVGGVPRSARRWLLVALLVLVAATVTAWPSGRVQTDETDETDEPSVGTVPVRRVASVELPPVGTRVQLASRAELDVVAREAGVPVLERDDGWAAVVTQDALHWWEPAGIPAGPPRWTDVPAVTASGTRSAAPEPLRPLDDVWTLASSSVHDTPTLQLPVLDDESVASPVPPPAEVDVVDRLRDELMVPRRALFRARPLPPPAPAPASAPPAANRSVDTRVAQPTDTVQVRSTIDEIVAYLTEVADRGGRTGG